MSSYNENLSASVTATLQSQELNLINTQAQLNAAMFTLYYADGAEITAKDKLDKTEKTYNHQKVIQAEAVENNNIAVNVLAIANQEKQYTQQSVTNAAVAAANVQVATTAIVNLASDMCSILSILNAGDNNSLIFKQTQAVCTLMDDTAYDAEVGSQWSMEASSQTAEISASTVADMATTTATSMSSLLTTLTSQLQATMALKVAENATLVSASVDAKKAEGAVEDNQVDYDAALSAYQLSVGELNLNLSVSDTLINARDHSFNVKFDPYLNPFCDSDLNLSSDVYIEDPVEKYYIIVVKETDKSVFSLATAEGLIGTTKIPIEVKSEGGSSITQKIDMKSTKDSSGKELAPGVSYVVFVLVQFTLDYKKILNNYEDYLTAAAAPFTLNTQLSSAKKVHVTAENQTLHFHLEEAHNNITDKTTIEYRCMFLADNSKPVHEPSILEEFESEENQQIVEKQEQIAQKQEQLDHYINELDATKERLRVNEETTPRSPKLDAAKEKLTSEINTISENIVALEEQIQDIILDAAEAIIEEQESNSDSATQKLGFVFNLLIAESVAAGNYKVADANQINNKRTQVTIPLSDDITDNFGNLLVDGNQYIPVVLSYASSPDKSITAQYVNALSDFQNTPAFMYSIKN